MIDVTDMTICIISSIVRSDDFVRTKIAEEIDDSITINLVKEGIPVNIK